MILKRGTPIARNSSAGFVMEPLAPPEPDSIDPNQDAHHE
jgi:hypothetical protein